MKVLRKRFTLSEELARDAEDYALMDNRTFSELVCEALRQHIKRYPRARKNGHEMVEKSVIDRIALLEEIVRLRVPAGTQDGNPGQLTEIGKGISDE